MRVFLASVSALIFVTLFYFPVAVVTSAAFGSLLWQLFSRYRIVLNAELKTKISGAKMKSGSGLLDRFDGSKDFVTRKTFQPSNYNLSPRSFSDNGNGERMTDYSQAVFRPRVESTYDSSFMSPPSSQSSFSTRNLNNTFSSPAVSILSRSDDGIADRSHDRRVAYPTLPPGSYPWIAPSSDSSAKMVMTLDRVPVKMRLSKPSTSFQTPPDTSSEEPPEPDSPKQIIQALKALSRKRMYTTESDDDSQDGANVPKRRMDIYHNLSASQLGSTGTSLEPLPESQENSLMDASQSEANGTENHVNLVQPNQISNKRPRAANDSGSQLAKKRSYTNEIMCSLSSSLGLLDPKLLQRVPKRKDSEKVTPKRQKVKETSCVEVQTLPSPVLKDDLVKDKQDKGTGTDVVEDAPPSASKTRPEVTVRKVEGARAAALLRSALMKFKDSGDLIPVTNLCAAPLKSTSEAAETPSTSAPAVTSEKPTEAKATFTFGVPQQNAAPVTTVPVVSDAMTLGTPSPTGDNPGFPTAEKSLPKSDAPGFKFGSSTTAASTAPVMVSTTPVMVSTAPVMTSVQQLSKVQDAPKVSGFTSGLAGAKPSFTFGAGPPHSAQNGTATPQAVAPVTAAPSIFSFGKNPPTTQVTTVSTAPTSTAPPSISPAPTTPTPSKPGGFSFTPTGTFSLGSSTTTAVATTTQSTPTFTFGGSTGAVKADAKSLFGMPQPPAAVPVTKAEPSKIFGSTAGGFNFSTSAPATTNPTAFPPQTTPKTEENKQNSFSGGFGSKETGKPFTFGSTNAGAEPKKAPFTFGSGVTTSALGGTSTPPTFGSATSATPAFGSATSAAPTFGATSAPPTFGATSAAPTFGATSAAPTFGATSAAPTFGATSAAPTFGSATSAAPTFGTSTNAAPTFGSTTSAAPTFGSATSAAPAFGSTSNAAPTFGAPAPAQFGASAPSFTATTTTSAAFGTGSTSFSAATPRTFAFGGKTADAAGSGLFGATASPAVTTTGVFGSTNTATTGFGSINPAPLTFGAPSTTTASGFGATAPAAPAPTFGSLSSSASAFGSSPSPFNSTSTFGSSTGFGSGGQTFGSAPTAAPPAPAFGSSATPAPAFGAGGFGSTPAFGSSVTPTFGSTSTPSFTAPQTQAAPFNFSAPTATAPSSGFNFSAPPQQGAKPMFQFGAPSTTPAATPGAAPFAFGGAPGAPVASGGFQNTMFSIGSGSSAPRSRTTQRTRKK